MGDYGVAVPTNIGGLSSVNNKNILPSKGLFTSDSSPTRTMQDDILHEKPSSVKQTLQLAINPENGTEQNGDKFSNRVKTESITQLEDKRTDVLNNVSTNSIQFGEGPNGIANSTAVISSMSSAPPTFWSNAATDDTYLQGFPSVNGTVAFQQFAPTANNVFNAALASHMGINAVPQQQSQRRAITAHHNFPHQQRQGMLVNNNSKSYPNWSNAPQQAPSWSAQQTQSFSTWANVPHQRRSMPNMNPVLKKQNYPRVNQSTPIIAPSKFRRSTSFPGQMHQTALMNPKLDLSSLDDTQRDAVLSYQVSSLPGNLYYDTCKFS